jgi:predicted nucleic-acid-binding Zn-ribbon protein
MENTDTTKMKKCNKCGNDLPLNAFYTYKKNDKIRILLPCKKCRNTAAKKQYLKTKGHEVLPGIDNENQIGNVLRTLSEMQFFVDDEKAKTGRIIEKIRDELYEAINPLQIQIRYYKKLLDGFFKKIHNRNFRKDYTYGSVNLRKGKLILTLNPDLANIMKDKP